MKSKLMISAAAAALIASTCLAAAEGPGPAPAAKEGPAPAAKAAPAPAPAAKAAPMTRTEAPAMHGPAAGPTAQKASEEPARANQAEQRMPEANPARRAEDTNRDEMKPNDAKAAEQPNARPDDKTAPDNARTTTGQAGAGAKLTSEQRTSVKAAIDKQHVRPATNINFSISIGTRVPRTVEFYPVPTELVTYYPSWRGYEYFLVGDQIIVVNPRTDEIVAVLDA